MTPPRDSKGRFISKSKARRKRKRNLPPRGPDGKFVSRNSYKANPVSGDIVQMLTGGAMEAGQILVGKAAVRSIPQLTGMPRQGNVGLAIQAALAVGVGFVADQFLSKDAARAMLAGGLTAPLETAIVSYNVPWLSDALGPQAANNDLSAYVQRSARRPMISRSGRASGGSSGSGRMGSYVQPSRRSALAYS